MLDVTCVVGFGTLANFTAILAVLGESVASWDASNSTGAPAMSWCGLLQSAPPLLGLHAEAIRTTSANDGVRAMLEDRQRLRARATELGTRHLEVCNEDLSSSVDGGGAAWAKIAAFVRADISVNLELEATHRSDVAGVDRAALERAAAAHLEALLPPALLAEYPCTPKNGSAAVSTLAAAAA